MLADLDELILRCRDERARAYIGEAVACYKAGANRAAIVATWIAVTFDIIDKLRELALTGDKAAVEVIEDFDAITEAHDLIRAQKFERELLAVAKNRFELISPQEHVDLERLQADRHRCAHPSQSGVGQIFSPSPELARFHIRCAVEHLLQQEPAQGKAALEGLIRTIESDYFPTSEEKALAILEKSPLKRARTSLVRNLTLLLLKALLKEGDSPLTWRRHAALRCIRALHQAQFQQTMRASLTALVRVQRSPEELTRGAQILAVHSDIADALERDQVVRLSEFIERMPSEQTLALPSLTEVEPLKQAVNFRVSFLTLAELRVISANEFLGLPPQFIERLIDQYTRVMSFDEANEWGKVVMENAYSYTAADLETILRGALANAQILGSFQLPPVIAKLKQTKLAKRPDLAELIERVEVASRR